MDDLLQKMEQEKLEKAKEVWRDTGKYYKKSLIRDCKTWRDPFNVRYSYPAEVNILRAAGAFVAIVGFSNDSDGNVDLVIDVHSWSNFNSEIIDFILGEES